MKKGFFYSMVLACTIAVTFAANFKAKAMGNETGETCNRDNCKGGGKFCCTDSRGVPFYSPQTY